MRDIRRRNTQQQPPSRPALIRGADGRLRPTADDADIGDLWAEQRRIRLAEAIEEDKRKAAKKQLPWWRRIDAADNLYRRLRQRQRPERQSAAASPPKQPVRPKGVTTPASAPTAQPDRKEIAVVLSVPSLSKVRRIFRRLGVRAAPFAGRLLRRLPRKKWQVGLAATVVLFVGAAGMLTALTPDKKPDTGTKGSRTTNQLTGRGPVIEKGTPSYPTLIPQDKTIDELGGWARVSPPGKDPVYAYADNINDVPITVSQQPLPAQFKTDPNSLAKMAEQFNAKEKIAAGEVTVYVGTSAKGPQSAIAAKGEVLILIKADAAIPNSLWGVYIAGLK